MKTIVKKGSVAYLSLTGHRGFRYPSEDSEKLLFDVEAEKVSWVGGGGRLTPVKVPESSILALGDSKRSVVVWVNKT